MRFHRASLDRSAAFRSRCLSLAKTCSMGEMRPWPRWGRVSASKGQGCKGSREWKSVRWTVFPENGTTAAPLRLGLLRGSQVPCGCPDCPGWRGIRKRSGGWFSRRRMSPGLRVGSSTFSTWVRKTSALIPRHGYSYQWRDHGSTSKTQGAPIRSWRRAARNVMVFQWPNGALPLSRMSRGPQPRSGAILVLVQPRRGYRSPGSIPDPASTSMKTRRCGSTCP